MNLLVLNRWKLSLASPSDNSLFDWGLFLGIMYMMFAGKAEINKLNKTLNETAKLVQELKSEVNKRKSSCDFQNLDSVGNGARNSSKIRGRNVAMHNNTNSELRDTDLKIWSPAVNDCGECGSSALTEEPEPQVLEMDQLEAELEFELQKLSGCTTGAPCYEETKPCLDEVNFWGAFLLLLSHTHNILNVHLCSEQSADSYVCCHSTVQLFPSLFSFFITPSNGGFLSPALDSFLRNLFINHSNCIFAPIPLVSALSINFFAPLFSRDSSINSNCISMLFF